MFFMEVASFFAGVGGIELAFEQAGFTTVFANELDRYARETYSANFNVELNPEDINDLPAESVPLTDVMTGGFPCQPFSQAGYRQGFDDEQGRGNLYFELDRLYNHHRPSVVFFENVRGLVGHDKGNTFRVILEMLHKAGYHVRYKVLNAAEYGNIPQNRERIYIVGFLDEHVCDKFRFPDPIPLTTQLSDVIDFNSKLDDKYYYTEDKHKFYPELMATITDPTTIYQWRRQYVRQNQSGLVPTLTANMGTGGHNVPLVLTKHGIRKLTPRECFNVQGFPQTYVLPEHVSNGQLYKQAGNSVAVPVVRRIAEQIKKAIETA